MIITGYIILMAFFIQTEMIIIHLFLMTAKFGEFEKKNIDDFDHPNKQIFSLLFISLITSYFMIIVVGGMTIGTAVISLNLLTMVFLSKLIKKENIDILLSNSWKIVDKYSIIFLKISPFITILTIIFLIIKL